ncbi:ATP-binding protein [Citreimonas sp.]|uniref:ATP-binding protein n=1 Tax=Citreimonas sp. TaxID=3036715 RepID=UPI0035C80AB1
MTVETWDRAPRSSQMYWLFAILFVMGMAITAILYVWHERRVEALVEMEAAYGELELALSSVALRMSAMASIIERTDGVTPSDFAAIYEETSEGISRRHERAIALVPYFDDGAAGDVDRLVDDWAPAYRAAGYPAFEIFPPNESGPLMPALMVEPAAVRDGVVGFDFASSAPRFSAARRALESGAMALSAPVALSEDQSAAPANFVLVLPYAVPGSGADMPVPAGVIGARLTPESLFGYHVPLFDHIDLAVTIGVGGGAPLGVDLDPGSATGVIPLLAERRFDAIELPGIRVPFYASASLRPRLIDLFPPVFAVALSILLLTLIARQMGMRHRQRIALERALARKEIELRAVEETRSRAVRLEALGRLVGGVAHDFNNILSVVMGNLELMANASSPERRQLETDALAAAKRGAYLTKQLLSYGRRSHLRPVDLDVAAALREATHMLRRVLPESIDLTARSEPGLWHCLVDPDGLQNALLNLALNARDALGGRGSMQIEATNLRITDDDSPARPRDEIAPGRYVSIAVTDDGAGMDAATLDRAFDPFFTTKHMTDGSGMGLPSVLGFCKQSGGTCRLFSEPGVGTTAQILLPAAERAPARAEPASVPGESTGGGTILLAEDEQAVGRVMKRQLEQAGFAVTLVPSGDEALAVLEGGARFDLLITDIVMGGNVQGPELAGRVERDFPGMSVFLVSGYPRETSVGANRDALARYTVLAKPVPRAVLIAETRAAIDRAHAGL